MAEKHSTVRSLIGALGGQGAVAEMVGLGRAAISVWCRKGEIPAYMYLDVRRVAKARGIAVDQKIFRLVRKSGTGRIRPGDARST